MIFEKFKGDVLFSLLDVDVVSCSSWVVCYPLYLVLDVLWEIVFCAPLDLDCLFWVCGVKRFKEVGRVDASVRPSIC